VPCLQAAAVKVRVPHVDEDQLQRFALGRLSTSESLRIQRHLFNCKPCLKRLVELEYKLGLQEKTGTGRAAVSAPHRRKPLFIRHDTADGFIYCRVERYGRRWVARHWGDQLAGARECRTMGDANEFLARSFSEMFPEHRLGGQPKPANEGHLKTGQRR
jgi:hypothetical protein